MSCAVEKKTNAMMGVNEMEGRRRRRCSGSEWREQSNKMMGVDNDEKVLETVTKENEPCGLYELRLQFPSVLTPPQLFHDFFSLKKEENHARNNITAEKSFQRLMGRNNIIRLPFPFYYY